MIVRSNVVREEPVDDVAVVESGPGYSIASRLSALIYFLASIVGAIILVRFVLLLLGANQNNEFAAWMMRISQPLVGPFLSLFGYSPSFQNGVIEWTDLIALTVYWVAAAVASRLLYVLFAPRLTHSVVVR